MIQLTALEDWSVSEKQQWDSAIKFMENTLQDELDKGIRKIKEMLSLEKQPYLSSDISVARNLFNSSRQHFFIRTFSYPMRPLANDSLLRVND